MSTFRMVTSQMYQAPPANLYQITNPATSSLCRKCAVRKESRLPNIPIHSWNRLIRCKDSKQAVKELIKYAMCKYQVMQVYFFTWRDHFACLYLL